MRLTFLNFSVSTSLSGEKFASDEKEDISETNIDEDEFGQLEETKEQCLPGNLF